jgi:hypothetical protein
VELTGFEFNSQDGDHILVTGPCSWSTQYVNVEVTNLSGSYRSVRVTDHVRQRAKGH